MAGKDNQSPKDKGRKTMRNKGRRAAKGSMQDNLAQMMEQVQEPEAKEEEQEYEHLSDWVEDLIKEPKVPFAQQLESLKTMFDEQKKELPNDLSESVRLLEGFFGNAQELQTTGDLKSLQSNLESLSSKLNEEMLKGEVNLLAMLYDCETTEEKL